MNALQQFIQMVSEEYALIEFGKLEKEQILLNIAEDELNGGITKEQADELRAFYNVSTP